MDKCSLSGCNEDSEVKRKYMPDASTHEFCEDHDPLDDPGLSYAWIEVEDE